jgi:hypothetical protein
VIRGWSLYSTLQGLSYQYNIVYVITYAARSTPTRTGRDLGCCNWREGTEDYQMGSRCQFNFIISKDAATGFTRESCSE